MFKWGGEAFASHTFAGGEPAFAYASESKQGTRIKKTNHGGLAPGLSNKHYGMSAALGGGRGRNLNPPHTICFAENLGSILSNLFFNSATLVDSEQLWRLCITPSPTVEGCLLA